MTPFGRLPAWAPASLRGIYAAIQCEDMEGDIDLLERLLTDYRMEKVWTAIEKRTQGKKNPVVSEPFPDTLYFLISAWLSYPIPSAPPAARRSKYKEIAELAQRLALLIGETVPDQQQHIHLKSFSCHQKYIMEIAESARQAYECFDNYFDPYLYTSSHFESEKEIAKTMLIRLIYRFISEYLGSPLWETVGSLVDVALNLPNGTTTIRTVRSCVRAWSKINNNPMFRPMV